ncbi:MAG: hypothetical protein CME36_08595 [unclassified Hahellaceae]|nr:hypothetical protein [Hahellaceae bacterium]|tara:strand:+ start:9915 stop:10556 length:642 start_codon:yes stop_codon:yes gene_type:complete
MNTKSSAHYQRAYRQRLREQGLVKKEVWILPEHTKQLAVAEKQLRQRVVGNPSDQRAEALRSQSMDQHATWTTTALFEALQQSEFATSGLATLELIDGVEQSIHIQMHELGDLPIFLTVSGEQMIAEAVLWPATDVKDIAAFNDAVLRTHKYFPLSTISLDKVGDDDYYHMFGALSSASLLQNVILEIEVLGDNVIQATEGYAEYLHTDTANS